MIIKSTFYHLHLFTSHINYIFSNCPMKNNLQYDHCWIGSKNVKAFLNSDRCELSIAEHCSLIKLVYFPPRLHLRCMANLPHSHVICWRMITVTIWCYQYIIIVEIPIIICNHKLKRFGSNRYTIVRKQFSLSMLFGPVYLFKLSSYKIPNKRKFRWSNKSYFGKVLLLWTRSW